jgi:spermidine synthase
VSAVRAERRQSLAIGFAVFVAGAALLGVEIAASRVLAPFFGSSLFVWGALIGVVLAGLSLGYWAGGALADRYPALWLLVAAIGAGAASVLAIPIVDEPVLRWIVDWDPGPRADPLLAATILFGLPSVLFAMVSPIAIRLRTRSVASVGTTAGRLYALSTAGSIAGTFATAFYLVPELGTDQLLGIVAATLFLVVALVAASQRLVLVAALALAATAGAAAAAQALAPEKGGRLSAQAARNYSPIYRIRGRDEPVRATHEGFEVRFAKDTRYHRLAVVDDQDSRFLRFDSSFQSGMYLKQPFRTRFRYTDYFELGFAYKPTARNILFLGLGGGSAPKRVWRDFPDVQIQVVEIDPVVADVAYRWFALPRSPRLKVDVEDGRRWLERHDTRFDVIAIDTYFSDSIPFHLTTQEFMEVVRERLAPGGIVLTNVIGALEGDGSKLMRSIYRTMSSVFPTVHVHPVVDEGLVDPETLRNIIVVATEGAAPSEAFLNERWRDIRGRSPKVANLAAPIRDRLEKPLPVTDVPVLTDDYAPTDALLGW